MELIPNFQPPVLTRTVYHSAADRETWAPRVQRVNEVWPVVERMSVVEGMRPCAIQTLTPTQYLELLAWGQRHGVYLHVGMRVKGFEGFSHRFEEGDDLFVTALSRDPSLLESADRHLGYPACCAAWFEDVFGEQKVVDPIWQWAGGGSPGRVTVYPSPYANPMLRYLNLRFAPHIPCSPSCGGSVELSKQVAQLMPPEVVEWLEELLSGDLEWDCYRGVAIVRARPFRIVVGSNPTRRRYVVRSHGHTS